jgi:hypothetical protein
MLNSIFFIKHIVVLLNCTLIYVNKNMLYNMFLGGKFDKFGKFCTR